jgi:uncharacterized membrane protein
MGLNIFKRIIKMFILFLCGGLLYLLFELIFRGYSHWTMFILGSICFLICDSWNEVFSWKTPLWFQMLLSAISITILEFVAGYIINIKLMCNVWNYSTLDFMGQISLPFFFIWFGLSLIGIILSDFIRWKLGEEKPHYIILWNGVI